MTAEAGKVRRCLDCGSALNVRKDGGGWWRASCEKSGCRMWMVTTLERSRFKAVDKLHQHAESFGRTSWIVQRLEELLEGVGDGEAA